MTHLDGEGHLPAKIGEWGVGPPRKTLEKYLMGGGTPHENFQGRILGGKGTWERVDYHWGTPSDRAWVA